MSPLSAKALEREDLEPPPELVEGCLRSVLAAHARLRSVLGFTPVKATGRLLLQVQISAEELAKLAGEEHRALVNANWRRK